MSSSKWDLLEALSVFAMIMAYIWLLRFSHPLSWILILLVIIVSHTVRRESPIQLGFGAKNLRSSATALAPVVLALALALLACGWMFGTIRPQNGLLGLLMYLVWGLFQQYVLNGYFMNRLHSPLLAAALFSAAHAPNWFLMLVTLGGGYFCARAYLRFRNLYFLGLAHGVIGFLIYLVVPDTISHHLYVGPKWFS